MALAVRLVAVKGVGDNQFVSCAELRLQSGPEVLYDSALCIGVGQTQTLSRQGGSFQVMNPSVAQLEEGAVCGKAMGSTWVVWQADDGMQIVLTPVQVKEYFPTLQLAFTPDEQDAAAGVLRAVLSGADSNAGKTVVFDVDGRTQTAVTDETGTAEIVLEHLSGSAPHTFGALFAGDERNASATATAVTYRVPSEFRLYVNFERDEDKDFFVDYSNQEDDKPGRGEIVEDERAISGSRSLRVFNEAGTFWSNGVVTSGKIPVEGIDGFAFKLKAAAGTIVKPMLHIDTLNEINGDLRGGFVVTDLDGTPMQDGWHFWDAWGSIVFEQDFEGYLFLPYNDQGFDDLDKITDGSVQFAFHFEHQPAEAVEYFVDDFGTYRGTDYAALTARMKELSVSKEYRLVVENGQGSGVYEAGATVQITADAPQPGMVFDGWQGDVEFADASSQQTTFLMPARDVTVTAVYREAPPQTHTVSVENGEGSGAYLPGEVVTITARVPQGKEFDGWTSGGQIRFADPSAVQTTFVMPDSDVVVTARLRDKVVQPEPDEPEATAQPPQTTPAPIPQTGDAAPIALLAALCVLSQTAAVWIRRRRQQ